MACLPPLCLQSWYEVPVASDDLRRGVTMEDMQALDELLLVYHFLLTPQGAAALFATSLTPHDRAMLLQRAAEHVSFNPRFVRVELLGVANGARGTLPAFDEYGGCDAYCVCRLVTSDQQHYPVHGAMSRIQWRTTRPSWRQAIELRLRGGEMDASGLFTSTDATTTSLQIQVGERLSLGLSSLDL